MCDCRELLRETQDGAAGCREGVASPEASVDVIVGSEEGNMTAPEELASPLRRGHRGDNNGCIRDQDDA